MRYRNISFSPWKRLIWFMAIERLETVLARKASYITVIAHPCLQNFSLSYYRTYNSISRQQYFVNFFILMSDCCIAESIRKDIKRYLTKWKYCLKFKEETFRFRFNYCLLMFIWFVKGTFHWKYYDKKWNDRKLFWMIITYEVFVNVRILIKWVAWYQWLKVLFLSCIYNNGHGLTN